MGDWARMAFKLDGFQKEVKIVLVGKYTGLQDSYLSVIKSLKVGCCCFCRLVCVESLIENDISL
jgi:CTP synthase (UTP-ammonia lyase)